MTYQSFDVMHTNSYKNITFSFIIALLVHAMLGVCVEFIWTQFSKAVVQPVPEFKIGNLSVVLSVLPETEIRQHEHKIELHPVTIPDSVEEKDSFIEEQVVVPSLPKSEEIKTELSEVLPEPDTTEEREMLVVPDTSLQDTGVLAELDINRTVLRPRYPLSSRFRGEEGDVLVKVEINNEGGVKKVEILKSSGFFALDREAVNSVKKAKFFTHDGQLARGGEAKISFKFRLIEP